MSSAGRDYDVIIIGGGPAGLSAGIYTARDRFRSLLIEKGIIGGQIVNAEYVENYPGFHEGISGVDLTQQMHQQAAKFGLETILAEATGIELRGDKKTVRTSEGDFTARVVIIAGGSERQKLGVPGEEEYAGKGVSYCATCDGAFFVDKTVAVVGGGDAAITEALHVTRFASRVILIHRRNELRATRIMQEKAAANPKIEMLLDTVVEAIEGDAFCRKLRLRRVSTGQQSEMAVDGVFISVGFKPGTGFLQGLLKLSEDGAIITNNRLETEIPGILAAGDIRHHSGRQVISAAGDGAS
ncbi:MAG: thioredoxin-disulfide reductase, partial [Chloroflexota bacterium]